MKARTSLMTAVLTLAAVPALAAPPIYDEPRPSEERQWHRSAQQQNPPAEVNPPPGRPSGPQGDSPRRYMDRPGWSREDHPPHGRGMPPPMFMPPPIIHPPGLGPRMVIIPRPHRPEGWYAPRMRAFRFCQTPRGAMMTLESKVLFDTDKSALRPAAIDTLEPLAAWLANNPGVEVAVEGHTDARASHAYNQALSERRAESVYAALVGMGATGARFTVTGYGETRPVATNATAAGMQLNRRVEITLLGQQAETFGGRPCR